MRTGMAAGRLALFLALAAPWAALPAGVEAVVLRWLDGDTVRVRVGPREETVRLIGIDAPEASPSHLPRTEVRGLQEA